MQKAHHYLSSSIIVVSSQNLFTRTTPSDTPPPPPTTFSRKNKKQKGRSQKFSVNQLVSSAQYSFPLLHIMTNGTNTYHDREFMRAAIVLNNSAATLLRKGHTAKALHLFKTVVSFLQQSTHTRIHPELLHRALRSAAVQVASVRKKDRPLFEIHVLDDDDDDDSARHEATVHGTSSSAGFVVRLGEHLYYAQGEEERDLLPSFHYLTAVVLYNFGVAFRCGFLSSSGRRELLTGAQRTLHSAEFLILQCANKADDFYELYRWHVLHVLVRRSVVHARQSAEKNCPCILREDTEHDDVGYFIADPEEVQYIQSMYQQSERAAAAA